MSAGKYQYIKKLATGGMAEVWLAKQTGIEGFNRHVVVKRILPHLAEDAEFVQMFLNEAKIAARFNHPNIAQIYELGEENGTYFIAMEFIHGEDLGRVMRRAWSSGQWVARHIALRMIADACQGLHYAHTRLTETGAPARVVHRDISPQNILISFDGAVKVVDFGIAKAADQMSNTKSGAIKGKFAYMAPEQAGGKPLDARTDVYALGLVLYELITGVRPLKRESELGTLQAALASEIDPPSVVAEVPHEIDEVVMRAIAKAPDDRYRDAREFHKAIEQFLVDRKEMATSVQVSELMEMLFADRLNEEKRLGAPNPSTESSTNNPAAPPSFTSPVTIQPPNPPSPVVPPRPSSPVRPLAPQATADTDEPFAQTAASGRRGSPDGTVGPSRKYAHTGVTAALTRAAPDSVASLQPVEDLDLPANHPLAAPELTRLPEPDHEPSEPPAQPAPAPRVKADPEFSGASLSRRSRVTEALNPPDKGEKRKGNTGQHRARRGSTLAPMPEAPPRRAKNSAGDDGPQPEKPSLPALSKLVDVRRLRARAASRLKFFVALVILVGLVVLGVMFRDTLRDSLAQVAPAATGVPVLLQVTTNPPTTVWAWPPEGNRERKPMNLGQSGTNALVGAYVGDRIVLINEDRGIRWETRLDFGEPNKPVTLMVPTFTEVALKVRTNPRLRNAAVWRVDDNGKPTQKLGQVGLSLGIFQGKHHLAIIADQLADPVLFDVSIAEGQKVTEQVVDVSASLDKPQPQ